MGEKKFSGRGKEYFYSGAAGKVLKSPTSCFYFSALCLSSLKIKYHTKSFYMKCSYLKHSQL